MIHTNIDTIKERGSNTIIVLITFVLCIWGVTTHQYTSSVMIGSLPFILILMCLCINKPAIILCITFAVNYLIMGINRYYPIPIAITNIFDLLYGITIALMIAKQIHKQDDFKNILNGYTLLALIWLLYCCINIGNGVTGEIQAKAWLAIVRPFAIYPLLTCFIISINCKNYTFIHYVLLLWGRFTLLAAAKGYWQKNRGFDSAELVWLWSYGYRTHFIHSGIRYFSFFTDAACFGCSMGLSCVVYTLTFFYTKNIYLRLFYLIVGMAGFYGLLISGTRAAIAVPVAGLGPFLFLSKNWKIGAIAALILFGGMGMLKYTTIGESNKVIRRMPTVFDTDDASLQVRFENQRALKAYMSEVPFGIGLGVNRGVLPSQNKYYFVATCPPDSSWVDLWIQMGTVGLVVFLILQAGTLIAGSYILLFRIRSPEIRGPLTGMLCGCAGMLVASYANMIYFQFPNGILIFSCYTFIFLGPYLDKQYIAEHEQRAD